MRNVRGMRAQAYGNSSEKRSRCQTNMPRRRVLCLEHMHATHKLRRYAATGHGAGLLFHSSGDMFTRVCCPPRPDITDLRGQSVCATAGYHARRDNLPVRQSVTPDESSRPDEVDICERTHVPSTPTHAHKARHRRRTDITSDTCTRITCRTCHCGPSARNDCLVANGWQPIASCRLGFCHPTGYTNHLHA